MNPHFCSDEKRASCKSMIHACFEAYWKDYIESAIKFAKVMDSSKSKAIKNGQMCVYVLLLESKN
jgi:hypothetical protein